MKSLLRPILWVGLSIALLLSLWLRPVGASSGVDPRLNRLESQVRSLQSQVTRLQSRIPRAGNSRPAPANIPSSPEAPSLDQQFDTLAILIIELQQRVSALETKLDETTESPQ